MEVSTTSHIIVFPERRSQRVVLCAMSHEDFSELVCYGELKITSGMATLQPSGYKVLFTLMLNVSRLAPKLL